MMRKKTLIITLSLFLVVISLLAGLFILFRTDYVSDAARKLIEPALESFYDGQITIKDVGVNPLPFFVELREVEVYPRDSNHRVVRAERIRVFISLKDFFSRKITISHLSFYNADLDIDKKSLLKLYRISSEVSVSTPKKGFTLELKEIELKNGQLSITDNKRHFQAKGIDLEARLEDFFLIALRIASGYITLPDHETIPFSVETKIKSDGHTTDVLSFNLDSYGSSVKAEGNYSPDKEGIFEVHARVKADSVKQIFNLQEKGDGQVLLDGHVLIRGSSIELDFDTQGKFYLQTLRELLAINDIDMAGNLTFNGKVQGEYPHITAQGTGKLEKGNLAFFSMEVLEGTFHYNDKLLTFTELSAKSYKGLFKGNAALSLETGDTHIKARVTDVNSQDLLHSFGLDYPLPEGSVKGSFVVDITSEQGVSVTASDLLYRSVRNSHTSKLPFVDKLKTVKGDIILKNSLLLINSSSVKLEDSELTLKGSIDLDKKIIDIKSSLKGTDAARFLSPYYDKLQGPFALKSNITGTFDKPEVSGILNMESGRISTFPFEHAHGEFTLNKGGLRVKQLTVRQKDSSLYSLKGIIKAPQNGDFSSLHNFTYDLESDIVRSNVNNLLRAASYELPPLKGLINAHAQVKGKGYDFNGHGRVSLTNGEAYGQVIDNASFLADFNREKLVLTSLKINENTMGITGRGEIFFNGRYNVMLSCPSLSLKDLTFIQQDFPLSGNLSVKVKGSGTVKAPEVNLYVESVGGLAYKGQKMGQGSLKASLVKNIWKVDGQIFDDRVSVKGQGELSQKTDYDITIALKSHRYDFILPLISQDIPEDVTVIMGGKIGIKGTGADYNLSCRFTYLQLGFNSYRLANRDDIVINFDGDRLNISSLSMTGRDGEFSASGIVNLKKDYNVRARGNINLASFSPLITAIKSLKGDADFNLNLEGPWHKPSVRGKIQIHDTFIGPENFPSLIGPINGEVAFQDDRFIINPTEAAFGGGSITLAGKGYLEGTQFKSFYGDLNLSTITIIPQEGLTIGFGGKLLLDFSPKRQRIDGKIRINHARFDSRFDFNSFSQDKGKAVKQEKNNSAQKIHLNIQFTADKNLSIENEFVKTYLDFKDFLIRGTLSQPVVLGTVTTRQGKIFFRGNIFNIINGRVDFINPAKPEPHFAIQAETKVREMTVRNVSREYKIFLNIEGTPDDLSLSLSSDDTTLSEKDMISLLALGSRGDEMVTVGKRLIDNKLHIMYSRPTDSSQTPSTDSGDIVRVEYSLGKNVSIVGERNENDSIGANLKFRFEF
jgi:autotransporter translocation and assembly factor TamB